MKPTGAIRRPLALMALAATALAALVQARADMPLSERRSSYDDMSRATQAMQDEDTANPGMLSVLDGEALWHARPQAESRACADCHGDARESMKGVAARYPAYDATHGLALNLEGRVNMCRTKHQNVPALRYESRELLALTAYIARQSRGMPIESSDAKLQPFIETGRRFYTERQGQLNLACVHCHDDNRGRKLAGNTIPQGHPTGYPLYRLEWQSLGSLQRRLRNCLTGMRAENYAYGSPELVALEAYLMFRARGMPMESPAVRP
jgi:sulfur-oxidizing protein SoxA